MKPDDYQRNCDLRWKTHAEKSRRYKEAWRNYSLNFLLMLALHRLEEVRGTYENTGSIDIDNMVDAMNFCDFILCKILDAQPIVE